MWFEIIIKRYSQDKEKNVTEAYMVKAVNWTDSEAMAFMEMKEAISEVFTIEAIKKSKVSEIFTYDSGEWWFHVLIEMIVYDEKTDKDKKQKVPFLVMADDILQAYHRINECLRDVPVDYKVCQLAYSKILDVFEVKR